MFCYSCHVHFEIPEGLQVTLDSPCSMSHIFWPALSVLVSWHYMIYIFAHKGKVYLCSTSDSVHWGAVLPCRDQTAQHWPPAAILPHCKQPTLPVSHCIQPQCDSVSGLCRPSMWLVVFCGYHSHSCKCPLTSFPAPDTSKYGHNTLSVWSVFVNPDTWNSTL